MQVTVGSGATLALQTSNSSDGTTGWSSGQIDTLLANTIFADTTAGLGIDTTNGNFTYGSNITQPISLTKLGPNTLTLTGPVPIPATPLSAAVCCNSAMEPPATMAR